LEFSENGLDLPRQTSFTYTGQETTYITKLFKHTNLKFAYRTNNSIELNLKPKAQTTNKHLTSGIYKLTCADCGRPYVDQTEISLRGTKNIIAPSEIKATPPKSHST
jgi:hypothetical protein